MRSRITDITEHPTREGKLYCCVVLDAYSRRVVGWSIAPNQAAALVTNALGMALENRSPAPGTILHSDHGTQGGFKGSSQRLVEEACDGSSAASGGGSCGAASDALTGSSVGGAAGGATAVLAGDRGWSLERGGGPCRRRVGAGGRPMVPRGWRDAVAQPASALGALPVVC
jgi:hypothetical protein